MTLSESETLELLYLAELERVAGARSTMRGFGEYIMPTYQTAWFHARLFAALDDFVSGRILRLMVCMPPRSGKSQAVSRFLPAYIFGRRPKANIIAASYSADLASRMNRDVQRVMISPEYNRIFPESRLFGKNVKSVADSTWLRNSEVFEVVDHGGIYRSAGVGGGVTGFGADYAIIDDVCKDMKQALSPTYRQSVWEWYASTLYSRLQSREAGVLVTMTRWHEDDLAGRLLAQAKADPEADRWHVIEFPAIKETDADAGDPRAVGEALWPDRFPLERLSKIRANNPQIFQALYQQRPTFKQGNLFQRAWLQFYAAPPPKFDEVILSWDMSFEDDKTADNPDYVVGQVWGRLGANRFLLDSVRGLWDFPATIEAFKSLCARWPNAHAKLVEKKANGPAVIATLRNSIPGIIPINPEGSKESRASAITPLFAAGNVLIPDPQLRPWVVPFMNELAEFPKGRNDDQVDAMTQALNYWVTGAAGKFGAGMIQSDSTISLTTALPGEW